MTTYAFPTLTRAAPSSLRWCLESNTQALTSPLTGSVQTIELPGARWSFTFEYQNLSEPDSAVLQAFLAQLRGQANRFTCHNFARPIPRGTAGGTPLVNNSSVSPTTLQTGTTLITDGWTAGATLLAGDFFAVNGELKMVTANGAANGSGQMTITFEPPLRASPADNAPITTTRPTATFMLTDPKTQWNSVPGVINSFTIQAQEQF